MPLSCLLQLCDLYENDCIFDKFDCCMNGAATYVASGSYNNSFKVFKCADGASGTPLEATRDPMRRRLQPVRVSNRSSWLRGGSTQQRHGPTDGSHRRHGAHAMH